MTIPPKSVIAKRNAKRVIPPADDMPPREEKCAFDGEYIDDGTIGGMYGCDAPNIVKLLKAKRAIGA
ncbi:hypothetical protein E5554_12275 [Sphingobium sp. PAMC28499]|uniref:hypothetical protein n=1 Tax=Sphingobium sp. PAMC28499 TaxID=2565554 RepID=UPI00109DA60A|nr:hypothetical protein [Sphingobium sp. PAMC28499]QCB38537.1 hypothetical protein E5554_12275 [Sphingobium sp. PAMC28499]